MQVAAGLEKSKSLGSTVLASPFSMHCAVSEGCPLVEALAHYRLWLQYPEKHKIQRLAATAKHPSVKNVIVFPWKC